MWQSSHSILFTLLQICIDNWKSFEFRGRLFEGTSVNLSDVVSQVWITVKLNIKFKCATLSYMLKAMAVDTSRSSRPKSKLPWTYITSIIGTTCLRILPNKYTTNGLAFRQTVSNNLVINGGQVVKQTKLFKDKEESCMFCLIPANPTNYSFLLILFNLGGLLVSMSNTVDGNY